MSTHKSIDLICVAVLLLTLLLTVLFMNGGRLGIQTLVDEDAEGTIRSTYFTPNDLRSDWDSAAATVITLHGDSASVSGGGAYFYDGDVIISSAGNYVLRGTLEGGSIVVDAEKRSKVWLLLDGVELSCGDDACLRVDQADKVFLTLAEGTDNRMSGGSAYSEEALADGTDGVIFSHDDLTINGSGRLTITAESLHGISVNDDLVITGGTLTVTAPDDGLHANDALYICKAEITLDAGDDGLYIKNPEGLVLVESGELTLRTGGDGIHSGGPVQIADGSIRIEAEGDGIQSDGLMQLGGGEFQIRSADDAIHSGADIQIMGGSLSIHAADDAVHADAGVSVTDGRILIEECYEGIEALTIDVSGGEVEVHCSDDGLNANGGSDPFGGSPAESTEETWIHISGGSVTVINETARDADGLDSNGDIVISGGTIRVSLPGTGSNNALDCGSESGGVCLIDGGDVVACGSSSMAESVSSDSAQCSLQYICAETVEAGTTLSLQNAAGETLVSYTPPCAFDSVVISSPEMKLGETVRLVIGGLTEEFTLSEVSTAAVPSSGFGGFQRPGSFERPEKAEEDPSGQLPLHGHGPDGGQMGPPPELPDAAGGKMSPPPGMQNSDGGAAPADEKAAAEETSNAEENAAAETAAFVPTAQTWILLALSLLALAGGLVLAIRFKP